MLKGALQRSVYPQRTGSIYRRLWQPLQIGPCMLVLILPTPGGWKAEWTLAGKKVTQIFNPRPGRESNRGPQDWEAEILTTAPTPPLISRNNFKKTLRTPRLILQKVPEVSTESRVRRCEFLLFVTIVDIMNWLRSSRNKCTKLLCSCRTNRKSAHCFNKMSLYFY